MKTAFLNRLVKTIVLSAFLFMAFTMSAFASPVEVSWRLQNQFKQQFHNASDVRWKTTSKFTSATFTIDGEQTAVYYNPDNEFIGISKVIAVEDLPKAARRCLTERYSDYKVISVIDFTDADDVNSYYVQLEDGNKQIILQSDTNGRVSTYKK